MRTKIKHITTAKKLNLSQQAKNKNQDLVTVIILCDIELHRMKSCGPLPLIDINGKKLIDIQISSVRKYFKNVEIIICVANCSDKIYKYVKQKYKNLQIRIVENQNYNSSNSLESVRISLNNTMNNRVLIFSGDLMLDDSISNIDQNKTCILIESNPSENLDIGVNIDENNIAQHFSYGASKIWSEVIFFHNEDYIDSFRKNISANYNKNKFMFEILNDLVKSKNNVLCINNSSKIEKINNIKTYHRIKEKA
jgi:NDP-sugar pyrophosphorylase family protein